MISIDTYISILFSIIIAAFLSAFCGVIMQNISLEQKIKITIFILCVTIFLILIATLIFYHGKYNFKIPTLWNFKNISNLKWLPFNNKIFEHPSFYTMYNMNIYISIILFIIEYKKFVVDVKPQGSNFLTTIGFLLLLFICYAHIWVMYITCIILFKYFAFWLCIILQAIIYTIFFYIATILFCFIIYSKHFFYLSKKKIIKLVIKEKITKKNLKNEAEKDELRNETEKDQFLKEIEDLLKE